MMGAVSIRLTLCDPDEPEGGKATPVRPYQPRPSAYSSGLGLSPDTRPDPDTHAEKPVRTTTCLKSDLSSAPPDVTSVYMSVSTAPAHVPRDVNSSVLNEAAIVVFSGISFSSSSDAGCRQCDSYLNACDSLFPAWAPWRLLVKVLHACGAGSGGMEMHCVSLTSRTSGVRYIVARSCPPLAR